VTTGERPDIEDAQVVVVFVDADGRRRTGDDLAEHACHLATVAVSVRLRGMDSTDIAFAGAAEQARMLVNGTITAPALLELYLDRIARVDRELRAYRVVLLDAGHLCQTFCLVATWLGLAPFCTAALRDTLIEKDLGIDGIREAPLYLAAVGVPPAGKLRNRR